MAPYLTIVTVHLYLLKMALVHSDQAQDCANIDTCVECVSQECGWIGSCSTICPVDAPCVSNTNTPDEDCDLYEDDQVDNAECAAKDSCSDCTTTPLPSDGSESCRWFLGCNGACNYCAATCNFFVTCEELSCSNQAQVCAEINDCSNCTSEGCTWGGGCFDGLCPTDTPCAYEEAECYRFEKEQLDNEECMKMESCEECSQTPLVSDVTKTCTWFDGSYCSSTCDLFSGQACSETPCYSSCTNIDNCVDCLTQGCSWTGSCDVACPTDTDCVSNTDSLEDDCDEFEQNRLDNAECAQEGSCDECIERSLPSNGSTSCKWFDGCAGTCNYCAATCNGFLGCNELRCAEQTEDCANINNCVECATQGCAWAGSCDIACPTDTACVSSTDIPEDDCDEFEKNRLDNAECATRKNCGECTETPLLSNGSTACKWFDGCAGTCDYCAATCNGFVGCDELPCSSYKKQHIVSHFYVVAAAAVVYALLWL